MKETFFIAAINADSSLTLLDGSYETYNDAMKAINALPSGWYQIQKFFLKA